MTKKSRTEIPGDTASAILFYSHRTCCVCREPKKPVQIHHIDEDPTNHEYDNLAVLCFDCHHLTLLAGGFARKLDAAQIIHYRNDWIKRVSNMRDKLQGPCELPTGAAPHEELSTKVPGTEYIQLIKIEESSEEESSR